MQLADLSSELSLEITDRLGIFDLLNLRLVSSFWCHFLRTHESTIYHSACIFHGFVRPHQPLESALSEHRTETQDLDGIDSWKAFCKLRMCVMHHELTELK